MNFFFIENHDNVISCEEHKYELGNSKLGWWNLHDTISIQFGWFHYFHTQCTLYLMDSHKSLELIQKKKHSPIVWYDINIKQDIAQSHIYLTYFLPTSTINTLDIENNTWQFQHGQSQHVIYQLVDVGELQVLSNNYSQFDELCTMETIKKSLVRPSSYYLDFKVEMHMNLVVTQSHNGVWSETKN